MTAKVYFTPTITAEALIKIYEALNVNLPAKTAVKISTGEPGGHNFLSPQLIAPLVKKLAGTIVECNTAYGGKRSNSKDHWQTFKDHGFMAIAPCDLMDETGEMKIPVRNGIHLKENIVGKNLANYQSMLVLSHFKGHLMGGFGGALKNMSIGVASASGKIQIHTAGTSTTFEDAFKKELHDLFLESMAEADSAVMDYLGRQNIVYINVANNLSVDCDCDSNPHDPEMADIGILASTDPVALDQASVDLVYHSQDDGKKALIERIESRHGIHTIEQAAKMGLGEREYELIKLDF